MRKLMQKTMILMVSLLVMLTIGSLSAYATIAPTQPSGEGTESSPYQISTKEELYWFAGLVNGTLTDGTEQDTAACAKLMNDIEIQTGVLNTDGSLNGDGSTFEPWTPIGSYDEDGEKAYTGTFDGDVYTISGLYCAIVGDSDRTYAGLFGYSSGTIKNVEIADSYFSAEANDESGDAYAGGICANSSGTIQNVKIADSYISAEANNEFGDAYAGGICANNSGTIQNVNLEDSYVYAYGDDDAYAGGICAENSSSITDCSNSGTISSITGTNDINLAKSGGICGYNEESGVIKNCYNTGTIRSESEISRAGGICGDNDGKITKCTNSGYIYAVNDGSNEEIYAGGICGQSSNEISDCSNSGQVRAVGIGDNSAPYAGGICGYSSRGEITNCYNKGEVESIGNAEHVMIRVGGICGCSYGNITNCANSGEIKGIAENENIDGYAGGICGRNGSNSYDGDINYCSNIGQITTVTNYEDTDIVKGGICGWNSSGTIAKCYFLQTAEINKDINGVGNDENHTGATPKSEEAYKSAEGVLALLNENEDHEPAWWLPQEPTYPQEIYGFYPLPKLGIATVSLNKTELTLVAGDSETLEATVIPEFAYDKTIEWESSNPDVATVDEGTITALNAGMATITVKSKDDSNVSIACKVTVKGEVTAEANPAEGGTIEGIGDYAKGEKVTLTAIANRGYRFVNWTENGTVVSTEKEYIFEFNDDRSLVANFKKISGTVPQRTLTFDTNGGSEINAVTENYGKTIVLADYTPKRDGYKFVGWYKDKALEEKIEYAVLDYDMTVYAKWQKITETVDYDTLIVLTINDKTSVVNGEAVTTDVAPLIVNDRTYTPARFVAESLGAKVVWDEKARTVTITKGEIKIILVIDSTTAYVNGEKVQMDASAFIADGRTFTPARFVAEQLGACVEWDEETRTVTIIK